MIDETISKWEQIGDDNLTQSLLIKGGHLYRTYVWDYETDKPKSVSMVFVPDKSQW